MEGECNAEEKLLVLPRNVLLKLCLSQVDTLYLFGRWLTHEPPPEPSFKYIEVLAARVGREVVDDQLVYVGAATVLSEDNAAHDGSVTIHVSNETGQILSARGADVVVSARYNAAVDL